MLFRSVLVNRAAWKTHFFISEMGTNRSFYFTNYSNGDSITLTIEGNFTEGLAKDKILIFNINMKNLQLTNLDGVKDLKGKIITLNGQNNSAMLRDYFQALGTKEFIGEQLEN